MLLNDIRRVLRQQQALIVHFSGTPRGIGGGQARPDFPRDLQDVRQNSQSWDVPCSTVSAGQTLASGHVIGSVGLVLRCKRGSSLLGVCHQDAGSGYNPTTGKRHLGDCVTPTVASCTSTITSRTRYNEWILTNYEATAVLCDPDFKVWDSTTTFERQTDIPEIESALPGLPILYFFEGALWELHPITRKRRIADFI